MKKIAMILAITLLFAALTGCNSNAPSGAANVPQSSSAPVQSEPSLPIDYVKPAEEAPEDNLVDPDEGGLIDTDPVEGMDLADYKPVGPTSIVEESPILDTLSADDKQMMLDMVEMTQDEFSACKPENKAKFGFFLLDTLKSDFDKRVAEAGLDIKYIDGSEEPLDLINNYRYILALALSGLWEVNEDGDMLVYNTDLFEKFRMGVFGDSHGRFHPSLTPEWSDQTIKAPLVDPFSYVVYSYREYTNPVMYTTSIQADLGITFMVSGLQNALNNGPEADIGQLVYSYIRFNQGQSVGNYTYYPTAVGYKFQLNEESDTVKVNDYPDGVRTTPKKSY